MVRPSTGICRLDNPIRHYAWGSHRAIAALQGRPTPSDEPEAELWIGAHPGDPSRVVCGGGRVPLDVWLRDAAADVLGERVVARHGEQLPFLLKVLAAAEPLSIQAHPDAEQARAGFARENAAGIPLDAPRRSYRDPHPKPELVCALTEFWALCGFRPVAEIVDGFRACGVDAFAAEVDALDATGDLSRFVAALLGADRDRAERAVERAGARAGERDAATARWLAELAARHRGDVGALGPLFLNVLRLEPDQAIYLGAGVLHSYLCGTGVEIMASSDNVLRGGLTPKHVDVPELLRTLRFEASAPPLVEPVARPGGERVYETPATAFELAQLRLDGGRWTSGRHPGPAVWLVTEGNWVARDLGSGDETPIPRGEAVLVPHSVERVELRGRGTAFRAAVGA